MARCPRRRPLLDAGHGLPGFLDEGRLLRSPGGHGVAAPTAAATDTVRAGFPSRFRRDAAGRVLQPLHESMDVPGVCVGSSGGNPCAARFDCIRSNSRSCTCLIAFVTRRVGAVPIPQATRVSRRSISSRRRSEFRRPPLGTVSAWACRHRDSGSCHCHRRNARDAESEPSLAGLHRLPFAVAQTGRPAAVGPFAAPTCHDRGGSRHTGETTSDRRSRMNAPASAGSDGMPSRIRFPSGVPIGARLIAIRASSL